MMTRKLPTQAQQEDAAHVVARSRGRRCPNGCPTCRDPARRNAAALHIIIAKRSPEVDS